MGKLAVYEKQMLASPDQQISLTDPDSRSMATSGRGSGVVGYNVQVAVDTDHHPTLSVHPSEFRAAMSGTPAQVPAFSLRLNDRKNRNTAAPNTTGEYVSI